MAPLQDRLVLPLVALLRRDKADTALAVFMVVPAHKAEHPLTGCMDVREAVGRVVRAVLGGLEQRLGEGVVVAEARSAVQRASRPTAQAWR